MKKSLLMALLTMGLFACSEKDIVDPAAGGVSGDAERSYLSVSIVPSQVSGTRAVPAGDEYRDGTDVENEVSTIRFYFFDREGNAAKVKADGASYYDVQKDEIDQNDNKDATLAGPVESIVSAMIVIESNKGDKKPAYMAAVLNHNDDLPKKVEKISDLQTHISNYSSRTQGTFTMSSSVYKGDKTEYIDGGTDKDGNAILTEEDEKKAGQEIVAVPVYGNIQSSREDAIKNTAIIYVERVLAKVSVKVDIKAETGEVTNYIDLENGERIYKVGYVGNQGLLNEPEGAEKIYVKFLGWNVTADRKKSRLVKDINTAWTWAAPTDWTTSWNNSDNFRSHWAINPSNNPETGEETETPIDDNYNFFEFATETADGSKVWEADKNEKQAWSYDFELDTLPTTVNKKYNYTYLQENAGASTDGTTPDVINSKIIVAAQLVDKDGNPLELVEWQGDIYKYATDTDKAKVLAAMAADTDLYIEDTKGNVKSGGTTWRKIGAEDVEIVFTNAKDADEAYERNDKGERRYYVYLKLKKADENTKYAIWKFYPGTDEQDGKWDLDTNSGKGYTFEDYDEEDEDITDAEKVVKDALLSIGYIKHWNTGYTYYWVDIRHFGKDGKTGEYGVVRNHWYEYTFTGVKGLGIPVSNPNEIIYPEVPGEPEYFYLAAEVRILSWRMVKNDNVGLGWDR